MSVMCFDSKKFAKVSATLIRYYATGSNDICLAWLFKYPDGWKKGLESQMRSFVQDLQRANTLTYSRQYESSEKWDSGNNSALDVFSADSADTYENKCQLLQALRSIEYNIVDNEGRATNLLNCREILSKLIRYVALDIVDSLDDYKNADTWGGV